MDDFSPLVQNALAKMTDDQRLAFDSEYTARKRSLGAMMALALLFPIQLFFFGKVGLGILFWVTAWGFGIWWIIEVFMTPTRLREHNAAIATSIARDTRLMA